MAEHDSFVERGRALEEDYFRRRDREILQKARQAAAANEAQQDLGRRTGLTDPALLQELHELGFTPDTVSLLPFVPLVQVAWAEGGITEAERTVIVKLARSRGITPGSAADTQLTGWLATPPSDAVLGQAGRLIRALLDATSDISPSADELVGYCEKIAAASGGIFGLVGRLSPDEREIIAGIAADLGARRT